MKLLDYALLQHELYWQQRARLQAATTQLGKWKSPGPDGLLASFFVDHWNSLGQEITHIVQVSGGTQKEGQKDLLGFLG